VASTTARGRARATALEPPLFAEIVGDAFDVEALVGRGASMAGGADDGFASAHSSARSVADSVPYPPLEVLPHAVHADPVRLARYWRHELGVGDRGPLPDLVPLLESAGVEVVHARLEVEAPHGACALVTAVNRLRPFIFVNGFGRPVALQRFALAHEFAHLALGHGEAYDERIDWSGRSRRETDTNAFAEEFVAPLAAVRHWFDMEGDPDAAAVETIVRLANHFGVSFWVARYRAKAAGVLSAPTQLRALDQQLRAAQWQLIPRQLFLGGLRDTLSVLASEARSGQSENPWRIAPQGVRVPGRMRARVLALLEAGAVSLEQAAAWLRIDEPDLRDQLGQFGVE
jgi:Zn-dependent peptidase ImmA (M78 family)